jgi:hypothetical protein
MSNVTKLDELVIEYEKQIGRLTNVPFIKFKSEIVIEYSSTPTPVPIGMADNIMYFLKDEESSYGHISWEMEFDDGEIDEVGMGVWFDGKEVTDYDGVFELSEYAIKFLNLLGYSTNNL